MHRVCAGLFALICLLGAAPGLAAEPEDVDESTGAASAVEAAAEAAADDAELVAQPVAPDVDAPAEAAAASPSAAHHAVDDTPISPPPSAASAPASLPAGTGSAAWDAVAGSEPVAAPFDPSFVRSPTLLLDHTVGAQYGPLGALYELDGRLRWDLFPGSDNILLKDAHVSAGLFGQISPSYALFGPSLTIAPLTILRFTVQFTHLTMGYLGNSLGLFDYSELGQFGDFSYAYRNAHGAEMGRFSNRNWALFLKPVALIKVARFIAVYAGNYMRTELTDFEGLYYNYIADMVLAEDSWCLMNQLLLLYEVANVASDGWGLMVGLSNKLNVALGDGDRLQTAARYLVGPMANYTFAPQLWGVVKEPSVVLQLHAIPLGAIDPAATGALGEPRVINAVLGLRFGTPL